MVYADYEFYKINFAGNLIAEDDFARLATKASAFLDYYTRGKAKFFAESDAVKMACCALAEQYKVIDAAALTVSKLSENAGGEKKSETTGRHSVTYSTGEDVAKATASYATSSESSLAAVVRMYLDGTGLLYRGGCHVYSTHCNPL